MFECGRKTILGVMLVAASALAVPATAQELSFGYQVQRFSSDGDNVTAPFGVSFSVAGPSSGALSLVGQLDWSRKHESETVFGTSVDGTANFTAFAAGTELARDGDYRYRVSHDEERIVFPNPSVKPGLRAGLMVVDTTDSTLASLD